MKQKNIKKLAILAGYGYLPKHVVDACNNNGIEYIVIGLDGDVSYALFEGDENYISFKPYCVSKILDYMKMHHVSHVTMAGKVKRSDLSRLLVDIKGAKLLASIVRNGFSDDPILSSIVKFLEKEGFKVIAPETIANDIVAAKGVLTKCKPSHSSSNDIKQGYKVLSGIANFDVGQALVIQDGLVLGVEAAEGTDELVKRCCDVKQNSDVPPILVKISKPLQEKRIDLPCIGPDTIENAQKYGLGGIAIESGCTLILQQSETIELANKYKIFLIGI